MTTLSFIAFHMADYQRDTMQLPLEGHGAYFLLLQHCWTHGRIPLDEAGCAAICKVTVQRWRNQLAPLVAGYFDEYGENKRATVEIAKAEKIRLRQAMAGHKGAVEANKRKAARKEMISAVADPRSNHGPAVAEPRSSHGAATLDKNIINTSVGTARARAAEPENPANSVAVEPPAGSAMGTRGQTVVPTDDLVTVIAKKGWV